MSDPTDSEIKAALQSIANLRDWIKELYEDTAKYEDVAFQALNATVQTPGWSGFIVDTVINLATGIIDAAAIAALPNLKFIGVLATDLLVGVLIGIAAKLVIHMARGVSFTNLFRINYQLEAVDSETYLVKLSGAAVFSNFIGLKSEMSTLPDRKTIIFDVSGSSLIAS